MFGRYQPKFFCEIVNNKYKKRLTCYSINALLFTIYLRALLFRLQIPVE